MDVLWTLPMILAGAVFLVGIGLWLFSRNIAAKVEKAMPPRGRFTKVKGGEIHAVSTGQGRPVIMIHGLSGNLHNFTYATTEALSGDFQVYSIDRPGCGHSRRDGDEQARLPEQARMIAEFIEAEGLEKPLIVGHSLGGAIALTLAVNHPDKLGGLALIAPLSTPQKRAPAVFKGLEIASPFLRRLIAQTLAVPLSIRQGAKALAIVFGPNETPEDFRTRGGGLLGLRPDAFYAASTDLNAAALDLDALSQRWGEITVPVGVIYGLADKVLDAETHLAPVEAIGSGVYAERLEGVGHMVQISRPDETEAFIRRMAAASFG